MVTTKSVLIWTLVAFVVGLITFPLYRKGKLRDGTFIGLPLFAFYFAFVLTITIIERIPFKDARYQLEVFWTYKAIQAGRTELKAEVFWNYILFIPIGILISMILPKKFKWLSIVISLLLSSGIEIAQLLFHRGLFEFDDIIHNTLGAMIGILIYLTVSWTVNRINGKKTK